MAKVELSVDIKPIGDFLEFTYTIKNTGIVNLCKNFYICSKILKRISCEPDFLIVPGDELKIVRTFRITEEYNTGPLTEKAILFMEVQQDCWVTAEAKKTIVDFGLSLANYGNSAVTVDGVTSWHSFYRNQSDVEGKDIYMKFTHSDTISPINPVPSGSTIFGESIPYNSYMENGEVYFHVPVFPIGKMIIPGVIISKNQGNAEYYQASLDIWSKSQVIRNTVLNKQRNLLSFTW